jgi:hypothetical protein|nr:MAG TPA: Protein of unknown function (DUF2829) [Caudoviricetes sp.]
MPAILRSKTKYHRKHLKTGCFFLCPKGESMKEMTFGGALEALKAGKKVARTGWNGKGMYLYLADGKLLTQEIGDGSYPFTDSVVMKTADNRYCIGWLASQTDMLAEDWHIVE